MKNGKKILLLNIIPFFFFRKILYVFTTMKSCVTFRKTPHHSICAEWKFEGSLYFERNNTRRQKTILLCCNYWYFIRFSTEGQQTSTYLLFWKEFWNRDQSVATWLVSRKQFHSLLWGNNVFFCFCKCCLYWINPSMFNSDKILWTRTKKCICKNQNIVKQPLSTPGWRMRCIIYLTDCWHYIFCLFDSRECQLLRTILYPFNLFCEPSFILCTLISYHIWRAWIYQKRQVSVEILQKGEY